MGVKDRVYALRLCSFCAGTFKGIPRKPAFYRCPICKRQWAWGIGFEKPHLVLRVREYNGKLRWWLVHKESKFISPRYSNPARAIRHIGSW